LEQPGQVERVRRGLVYAAATIDRVSDGEPIADATATLVAAPTELTAPRP
jgi:hypothetical protein